MEGEQAWAAQWFSFDQHSADSLPCDPTRRLTVRETIRNWGANSTLERSVIDLLFPMSQQTISQ